MEGKRSMKYTIGLDFGTSSARSVLVDVTDGQSVYTSVFDYPDGVLTEYLPESTIRIGEGYYLQNPENYYDALISLLKDTVHYSGVSSDDIIGIGIDFTSCTVLPLDENMQPLMMRKEYRKSPHSWVKLWKHVSPIKQAIRIDESIKKRSEQFITRYGGDKSSNEWLFAKALETRDEAPEVYEATSVFMEAGDWIAYLLTGNIVKSGNYASFKAMWSETDGYPSAEFFDDVEPGFSDILDKTGNIEILNPGREAGKLTKQMAEITGLREGISVAVPMIDAHAVIPAFGLRESGALVMVIGTSNSHILLSNVDAVVPGILGMGENAILQGYYAYDSAQAACGDAYAWVSGALNTNIKTLNKKMSVLKPGESGLIALDWLNGNRSTLKDSNLTGLIIGMTLNTKPEEIYRAFVEATAFGARRIIENYRSHGVPVEKLFAGGGIPVKAPEIMQIFADVLGQEIRAGNCPQPSALGSAIYAASAAGSSAGGYNKVEKAIEAMSADMDLVFVPNQDNHRTYNDLYDIYCSLYESFSKKDSEMKKLISVKNKVLKQ